MTLEMMIMMLPDVSPDLSALEAVGGSTLVTGDPLLFPLDLGNQPLEVVRLAPHLGVGGRQFVAVPLTW